MINNYNHLRTRSTRNHFMEPPSTLERIRAALPMGLAAVVQKTAQRHSAAIARLPRTLQNARQAARRLSLRNFLNVPNVFIAIWVLCLLWGERWVFRAEVEKCKWENWERWVGSFAPSMVQL